LRVLMLSQTLPPENRTGAPLQAVFLSRALVKLGVDVEILTTRTKGEGWEQNHPNGIKIHTLPFANALGPGKAIRFAGAAIKALGLRGWDVLHGHALSPMVLGVALARERPALPMLVKPSIGGPHPEGEISRIIDSPAASILRRAMQRIDRFAVLDELILADLGRLSIPNDRLVRVDNGVDIERFRPARPGEKREIRTRLGITGRKVVLFCGQLTARKGIPELLMAWSGLRAGHSDTVLAIAGDGPLEAEVREAVAASGGNIAYLGQHADIAPVIRMSDLLILPSRFESFGNVMVEALASGVPIAATPCGAASKIVVRGKSGWLIEDTRVGSIQRTLAEALADSGPCSGLGVECRRIAEGFAFERIAHRYLEIYQSMLSMRSGRSAR